jgi:cell shape-determining protein MreC
MNPRVKGESIYRDVNTNALVFTNQEEIAAYKAKKKALRANDEEINSLKNEIQELKQMVKNIVKLLNINRGEL